MTLTLDSLKIAASLRAPVIASVKSEAEFLKHVNFFTNESQPYQSARQEMYEEVQKANGFTGINEAKWHILKSLFAPYFFQQTQNALNLAHTGHSYLALERVNELKKLEPVFKPLYDVSNFTGFIQEIDSKMDETQAQAIFGDGEFKLSLESLDKLSNTILGQMHREPTGIIDAQDFMKKLVSHPLMYCLDLFKNENLLLSNLEDGTIDLGEYHKLAVTILALKKQQNSEQYDALIMFLIAQDEEIGLKKIARNEKHVSKSLHNFLRVVEKNLKPTDFEIKSLLSEVMGVYNKNYEVTTGGLERRINSKFSMNDSGLEIKDIHGNKIFLHIHTAQGKGEQQKSQQSATSNALKKFNKYQDTVSITISDDHIVQIERNAYLKDYQKEFSSLSDFDKYFLSTLQFDKNFLTQINNDLKENKVLDLSSTNVLAKNVSVIRKEHYMPCIEKYLSKKCASNDEAIIASNAKQLIRILNEYSRPFSHLFETTATQGQLRYEIMHEPILGTIKNILKIQKRTNAQIFSADDLAVLKPLIKSSLKASLAPIKEISGEIEDLIDDVSNPSNKESKAPNNTLFDELSNSFLLQKQNKHLAQQALNEKSILSNQVLPSLNTASISNFDFSKLDISDSSMKEILNHFSHSPHEIEPNSEKIKEFINRYAVGIFGATKLKNAIATFEDALSLNKIENNKIIVSPSRWQSIYPESGRVITSLLLENKQGQNYNELKIKSERQSHLLLANLFCLYIRTENVRLEYAGDKTSKLQKTMAKAYKLKTKFD